MYLLFDTLSRVNVKKDGYRLSLLMGEKTIVPNHLKFAQIRRKTAHYAQFCFYVWDDLAVLLARAFLGITWRPP